MASVRKRVWKKLNGEPREAWAVSYSDVTGKRRLRTFNMKRQADEFKAALSRSEHPNPLRKNGRPIMFASPLPKDKTVAGRKVVTDALRTAYPTLAPLTGRVIVHVFAEVLPIVAVADVDNLLKPVLDAIDGVAYINDNQIIECLVRRISSRQSRLLIKIWQTPD